MLESPETDHIRIHASALAGLPEMLAEHRLAFNDLAQAVGIQPDTMHDSRAYIGLDRFAKLLEVTAILTGDNVVALRFAHRQDVGAAGALTYAMRHAPTVREGFGTLIRYIRTRVDLAHMEFVVERRRAVLEWSLSPLIVKRDQIADYAAAAMWQRAAAMIAPGWKPLSVSLERPPPDSTELHRHIFGRAVNFDHGMNAIVVDAGLLDMPVPGADPHLRRLSIDVLDQMLAGRRHSMDLITHIREEIMAEFEDQGTPEVTRIAVRAGYSVRSLQRRLAEHDTSFQRLVDESRRLIAHRLLEDPQMPLSQIAYRLGFSAPSAFTRACYRWFGSRPKDARRAVRTSIDRVQTRMRRSDAG